MSALFSGLLFGLSANPTRRGAKALRERSCLLWLSIVSCRKVENFMHSPTAHGQLIHELPKSETRYRAVADAAFDAIVAIAPDGVVQWFNRGAERMFGYGAEKSSGGRSRC